jgi:hypothetical protein
LAVSPKPSTAVELPPAFASLSASSLLLITVSIGPLDMLLPLNTSVQNKLPITALLPHLLLRNVSSSSLKFDFFPGQADLVPPENQFMLILKLIFLGLFFLVIYIHPHLVRVGSTLCVGRELVSLVVWFFTVFQ